MTSNTDNVSVFLKSKMEWMGLVCLEPNCEWAFELTNQYSASLGTLNAKAELHKKECPKIYDKDGK